MTIGSIRCTLSLMERRSRLLVAVTESLPRCDVVGVELGLITSQQERLDRDTPKGQEINEKPARCIPGGYFKRGCRINIGPRAADRYSAKPPRPTQPRYPFVYHVYIYSDDNEEALSSFGSIF